MTDGRAELGRAAEARVAAQLEAEGFEVIARNARVGRLELDIVARRGSLIVICEVRARSRDAGFSPVETIDARKRARVRRAAAAFLSEQQLRASQLRFDAAAVERQPDGALRVTYYADAF